MQGISTSSSLKSLPPVRTDLQRNTDLLDYFLNTWNLYELLFSSIRKEGALYVNPDPLRHPLIFYYGHTAAFYINKLVIAGLLPAEDRINPHFEKLFEQGVDPAKAEELGSEAWPSLSEVIDFRQKVFDLVTEFIGEQRFAEPITDTHPLWSIFMGLEHDRIHFETSSMLIRQYPVDWVERPDSWNYAPVNGIPPKNEWLPVPESFVSLGRPEKFPLFGWDNEFGSLKLSVAPFEATKNLISNQEYLEFVQSGAYAQEENWTEKGWAWKQKYEIQHPRFWIPEGNSFRYRAMFDEMDLPMSWPAEVNGFEAEAYCKWKGNRLLSEGEFRAISDTALSNPFDLPFCEDYNLNLKFGSPSPVGSLPEAGSKLGFNDVWGNVWCWLSNDFYGFPGYQTHAYYEDFSAPYMDPDHAVLLGGSWASSGTSASRYYRLWFRRHFYQHAGFRMARRRDE